VTTQQQAYLALGAVILFLLCVVVIFARLYYERECPHCTERQAFMEQAEQEAK